MNGSGSGDRVATRRNDRDLGVANRDTWTVTAVDDDGTLTLRGRRASDVRTVPAGYVRDHVELAYATTVYGAQGETTGTGHLVLGEHTSAASAYVAMTRGRDDNVAHLVADDVEDARAAVGRRVQPGPGRPRTRRRRPTGRRRHRPVRAHRCRSAGSTRCWPTCGPRGPSKPTSPTTSTGWSSNATPSSRSR